MSSTTEQIEAFEKNFQELIDQFKKLDNNVQNKSNDDEIDVENLMSNMEKLSTQFKENFKLLKKEVKQYKKIKEKGQSPKKNKTVNENKKQCNHILVSGKKAGQRCSNFAMNEESEYCKRHTEKINKQLEDEEIKSKQENIEENDEKENSDSEKNKKMEIEIKKESDNEKSGNEKSEIEEQSTSKKTIKITSKPATKKTTKKQIIKSDSPYSSSDDIEL